MASGDSHLQPTLKQIQLPSGSSLEYQQNHSCYSHFCSYVSNLRLNDFPLGSGDWKSERFRTTHPNLESTDDLKDISRLNIYDFDENWSSQAGKLRQASIEFGEKINATFILNFFNDLRLTDEDIDQIDPSMRKLMNLKRLSLINTTKISKINFDNLPRNLEVFNFLGCGLSGLHDSMLISFLKPYANLIHMGLGLNNLESDQTDHYLNNQYFPNLISLDLSENCLTNLTELIQNISQMTKLKSLNISSNPFSLYTSYNFFPISMLNLDYFNDEAVSVEKKSAADFKKAFESQQYEVSETIISIETLTGLKQDEFAGSITVVLTSPYGGSFKTESHTVNSNIQLAQTFQFTVTHEFARALYSTVRGEENDYFQIEIIFKKGPEPSKKGDKKDGKKDKGKAKKDSKGNSAKTSRPNSQNDDIIEEIKIFSGCLALEGVSFKPQHKMVYLGGAEFNPETYVRPLIETGTTDKPEKGKGKGKKNKNEPKEDQSIPQPIVLNIEINLKRD